MARSSRRGSGSCRGARPPPPWDARVRSATTPRSGLVGMRGGDGKPGGAGLRKRRMPTQEESGTGKRRAEATEATRDRWRCGGGHGAAKLASHGLHGYQVLDWERDNVIEPPPVVGTVAGRREHLEWELLQPLDTNSSAPVWNNNSTLTVWTARFIHLSYSFIDESETFIVPVLPLSKGHVPWINLGVHSKDHRLEILRHKIAAKENELKGQKRPLFAVATKNADFSSNQPRLPSEKIRLEASSSGEYSRFNSLSEHSGGPNKWLKLNQQYNQFCSDLTPLAPIGSISEKINVQSSEVTNRSENGITMNLNVNETDIIDTTELADQIQQSGATKSLRHHKDSGGAENHVMLESHDGLAAQPPFIFTDTQTIPEDTSALAPITSAQARQQVLSIGTSPVLDGTPQLQPGKENDECLNNSGQIGVETQNTILFSLLEMEELQDKELEDAQEHRQKCESEAYRKAQRALLEANGRCAILRRKREICSSQDHGLIAENSSLVQSLSIRNPEDGLAMPSLLNSQIHVVSQIPENQGGRHRLCPEEPSQQQIDKHEDEARPHYCDKLAASTTDPSSVSVVNADSILSDYMEDDLLFPTRQARSECALDVENQMEETIHVYAEENRQVSGDGGQDYELLEASLRSRCRRL
ncbi:hypothetical protein Zm00014a_027130 [Zea mays]|uniref:Uncharacterized protein n=1 Tax=Zea mays TaxID=4577 RepID=A0A3L6DH50_MAIZE|nr:hypothetical protein Zm00014a_027130 [Zea mays]